MWVRGGPYRYALLVAGVVFFRLTFARMKPVGSVRMAQLTVKAGDDAEPQPANATAKKRQAQHAG
jgi:hypothetical protein